MAASTSAEAFRDRQLLGELLAPIAPAEAILWAERLIEAFGSLAATLAAEPQSQLRALQDVRPAAILRTVRHAMLHALRTEAFAGPILSNSQAVLDYLHADMAHAPAEQVRALFLDASNHLLRDAIVATGTINEAPIYPREIMRGALEANATGIILVHNHPSGDPNPSMGDKAATALVAQAARTLDIRLHDHLIIAKSGWTSFRVLGLL